MSRSRLDRDAKGIFTINRAYGKRVELATAFETLAGVKGHKSELSGLHLNRFAQGSEADFDGVDGDARYRANDVGVRSHAPIQPNKAPSEQGETCHEERRNGFVDA